MVGTYGFSKSFIYAGATLLSVLWVISNNLKIIHWLTGSQWR